MATLLTREERRIRIMRNVKGNKPSVMVTKFAEHARMKEAEERGEEYIPAPSYIFLIIDDDNGDGRPITLQTIQEILNERRAKHSGLKAEGEEEEIPSEYLYLQTAKILQHYGSDGEEAEVEGVKLRGSSRGWWSVLTHLLQPDNWTEDMVYYVQHLTRRVKCADVETEMEALRVKKHFENGEVEV